MKALYQYATPAVALVFSALALFLPHQAVTSFGATSNPGSNALYEQALSSPLGTADASMLVTSGADVQGNLLPVGSYQCLSVDTGQPNFEAICGNIAASTSSGLTLTITLRGLSTQTATTSVASQIFTHRRGADVRITDFPTLTIVNNQLNGAQSIPNPINYTFNFPTTFWATAASSTLVTLGQLNDSIASGCGLASFSAKGCVQLATGLQAASSTVLGSTGANLVLPSSIATDTPSVPQSVSGSKVVISAINGFIKQTWLDLSAAWNFTGIIQSTGSAFGFVPIFGDGSDSASTTAASYSLTRDEYFTNYTVSTGNTIAMNGFRIFVTGTLTVNGTINNSGGNGGVGGQGGDETSSGNGTQGTAGTAGAGTNGTTVAPSFSGTAGGLGSFGATANVVVGSSTAGTASPISFLGTNGSSGGAGGSGGNSICGSGSNAGGTSATSTATLVQKPTNVFVLLTTLTSNTQLAAQPAGGGGGGGGCSNNTPTAAGGGGGGGGAGGDGGYIFIAAKTITIGASGVISSNGGIGGAGGRGGNASGATGNVGGGGGGGGAGGDGGLIVLVYTNSYTNSGSVVANAGTAGVGGAAGTGSGGPGVAGNAGNSGVAGIVKTIQI